MQITEAIIERIARRVFIQLFTPTLRQSGAFTRGAGSSVQYAAESGHATTADVASSVDWSNVSGKPTIPSVSGSVSGSTLTITIDGNAYSLTNTWRGIQNNLTSQGNTTESLSAHQGYQLANGYARDSTKLPLSGGTMTGTLNVATGRGISDATGNGLLVYHPTSWTGVDNTQWGIGTIDSEGVIRSSASALKHYRHNDGTYEIIDSKGGQTIYNQLQVAQVKIEQTNEINSYSGNLYLQHRVGTSLILCNGGGNVGIGTATPSYKLHVTGTIYATGSITEQSDIRSKNIITYKWTPSVSDIADAPIACYTMKADKDKRERIGSIAQYWQKVIPQAVNQAADGILSMNYGEISLVSVIVLARKVKKLEARMEKYERS